MSVDPYAQFKDDSALPAEKKLKILTELAQKSLSAKSQVEELEEQLKKAKDQQRDIDERQIPDLMDELDLSEYKTSNGLKVKIHETIRASIPAKNKAEAYQWLDEHGHGGLIKRNVIVGFNREQSEAAKELMSRLTETFENVKQDLKVEPATLRAFIKERLSEGEDIPLNLFGAWRQRSAKIK